MQLMQSVSNQMLTTPSLDNKITLAGWVVASCSIAHIAGICLDKAVSFIGGQMQDNYSESFKQMASTAVYLVAAIGMLNAASENNARRVIGIAVAVLGFYLRDPIKLLSLGESSQGGFSLQLTGFEFLFKLADPKCVIGSASDGDGDAAVIDY